MRDGASGTRHRAAALLALVSLLVLLLGSSGVFGAESGAAGEICVGCAGCESGDCDREEGPGTLHHHCCTTSCMSHVTVVLPTPCATSDSVTLGPIEASTAAAVVSRAPETPYRPPRT